MKTLLTHPSACPGPTTLLILPDRPVGPLKTLSGDKTEVGFVAEVSRAAIYDAISVAVDREAAVGDVYDVEDAMRTELEWMARALHAFAERSPIGERHRRADRFPLDYSRATVIERVPGLTVGDRVVVSAPADEELVNVRGRVASLHGDRVVVALDEADHRRLCRSRVVDLSEWPAVLVPRFCLEYVQARRRLRNLSRRVWLAAHPEGCDPGPPF
jgi:hypothetical protein